MANDHAFSLSIMSPQGTIFEGEVTSVTMPTTNGMITILSRHMQLIAKLTEGEIEIKQNEEEISVVTGGGFLEVADDKALILSDYAVRAESIEIAQAEEKKRIAQSELTEKRDYKEFTNAEKALRLSSLELKVSEKMRRKRKI
jgi:F-type H+-transporting ATPase subunit epsilon